MKKNFLYLIFAIFTLVNLYLSSYSVLHGELNFINDTARDFLLLGEIEKKHVVLIGPRSNTSGLFHGPFWSYLNYPVYILSSGNPIASGWFWIVLGIFCLFTGFILIKDNFDLLTALAYVFLLSGRMIAHINGVYHSEATFFFMPLFLLTVTRFLKTFDLKYLILHLFVASILIQLNIGVGLPFLFLSVLLIIGIILRAKKIKYLLFFLLLPFFLANFIIFDIRHDFLLSKAAFSIVGSSYMAVGWLKDRIYHITSLEYMENSPDLLNLAIFLTVLIFTFLQIKKSPKNRRLYLLIIYYYFGYWLLSLINRGIILSHFVYLLVPITTFWLVSLVAGRYQIIFFPILFVVYLFNLQYGLSYINYLKNEFMGKDIDSYKGLESLATDILLIQGKKPFGYFVYSPDAFAYQPRYVMIYIFREEKAEAYEYIKKPTTYIIAAPPPKNNPYMQYSWWIKNQVKISNNPVWSRKYPNGFTVEKYQLSPQEIATPHDKNIELGIHFR